MKQIRFFSVVAVFGLFLAARGVEAQSSSQALTFSLLGSYSYETSVVVSSKETIAESTIYNVFIGTANIVRAIAVDKFGTGWTGWTNAGLVLRINMKTGDQAIYLALGTNYSNVSQYFNGTFTNNFTSSSGLSNIVILLTNTFLESSNNYAGWTNPVFDQSVTTRTSLTNTNVTGHTTSASLVQCLSLSTSNLAFNLVGVSLAYAGNDNYATVTGTGAYKSYQTNVPTGTSTAVGVFYLNTTSNLYGPFTNTATYYYSGPMRGTFTLSPYPVFHADNLPP